MAAQKDSEKKSSILSECLVLWLNIFTLESGFWFTRSSDERDKKF